MRAAIRYSEYKGAGKLPHKENFDCSTCFESSTREKRNCRGEFGVKYQYTIGTTQFYQCPVSVFIFDPDVTKVIDLIITSLESGIPIAGTCLLDQTPAFFKYKNIIQNEKAICYNELEKLRQQDMKKQQAQAKREAAGRRPVRRR